MCFHFVWKAWYFLPVTELQRQCLKKMVLLTWKASVTRTCGYMYLTNFGSMECKVMYVCMYIIWKELKFFHLNNQYFIFLCDHLTGVLPRSDWLYFSVILASWVEFLHFDIKDFDLYYSLDFYLFQVLNQLQGGGGSGSGVSGPTGGLFQPDLVQDFDPNILLDDLKEGSTPPVGRRSSAMIQESGSPSHHHHSNQSIQMAARMVRYINCFWYACLGLEFSMLTV
jgi:hypothetical protein